MNVWKDITGGTEGKDACVLSRRAQWRRRTLGTLCSIRRGNNSSAHVNQEFRTPLILRVLRCGILSLAVQLMKWASASIARRGLGSIGEIPRPAPPSVPSVRFQAPEARYRLAGLFQAREAAVIPP